MFMFSKWSKGKEIIAGNSLFHGQLWIKRVFQTCKTISKDIDNNYLGVSVSSTLSITTIVISI